MKPDQQLFLRFLRAGLWNEKIEYRLRRNEFLQLVSDARKQAVRGLVGHAMLSSELLHPKIAQKVQNTLFSIARQNMKMDYVVALSVVKLREAGIEPMLLKGQGVASYYHQPLLRTSGDIDLYVNPAKYREAFDILTGSLKNISSSEFIAEGKHSTIITEEILIELHQYVDRLTPKYDPIFQKIVEESLLSGYVEVKVDNTLVRTPDSTFSAMFIFEHIWSHFVATGIGFRQICDWVVFLHSNKDTIDKERLRGMIESLNLMKPWQVFGTLAVGCLGLRADEMPFYDPSFTKAMTKVLKMVMKEGNFGHEWEARWRESGNKVKDTLQHFVVISRRYVKMISMFGDIAFQEYKTKVLHHLSH